MEVKPGYKQTAVGIIPEDWDAVRIGDLFTFKNGLNKAKQFFGHGTPIVNYMDVFGYPGLRVALIGGRVDVGPKELSAYEVRQGDVFFTRTSETVEEIGIASVMLDEPEKTVYSGFILRARPSDESLDDAFKAYCFSAHYFRQQVTARASYTTRALTNGRSLSAALLARPPKAEQRTIATALSDVDALLDALDRLIAKKRDLKQAAMQQLLTGQTRLPGFSGEWEVKRLGKLADIRSGGTPSTTDGRFWDGDVPWCTPTDITALDGRKCLNSTTRTITPAGLAASSAEIIPAFSVVMTSRATIGECAINTVPLSTNQGFKNFVPFEEIDGEFLYYLLSTQKQGFIRLCGGSTFLEIGKTQLVAYEVRLPTTKDEQTAIAAVLSEMDAEIAALEARRAKTRDLKQAMMQELLTGRTRLVESNVIALPEQETTSTKRKANVHFVRSVFAAEIIDRLHAEPTFGHVKCQKLIYLAERMCGVDIDSHYHRDAAGPYDNRALRSIDRQLRAQKWFDAQSTGERYRYVPMEKRGGHKAYFDRYFADVGAIFDKVVDALRRLDTERCEIIATLFEAWHDLLARKVTVTDDAILREVLDHWHESKKRIDEDRWRRALGWMREKGFTPQDGKRP